MNDKDKCYETTNEEEKSSLDWNGHKKLELDPKGMIEFC